MESENTLNPADFKHYIESFNSIEVEDVVNLIPNAEALDWMSANIPLFTCPDADIERTYYFRWWTFRKHLRQTPCGIRMSEFIMPVKHEGRFQTISCALGHQIAEGRWLRDQKYLRDYILFWFRGSEGKPEKHFHKYSQWAQAALLDWSMVEGDTSLLVDLLDDFQEDYRAWEAEKLLPDGLFWQFDVRDGMEESISGSRKNKNARPTINSYMYANALAIAATADLAGKPLVADEYRTKAAAIRKLVHEKLWDPAARFFKVRFEDGSLSDAREAIGFIPWCFDLPERGLEDAWAQLIDPQGFWAPMGIATAERRHPQFRSHGVGQCEWDGAAWPFATSQTLVALANVLRKYSQSFVSKKNYLEAMRIYAKSHQRNGKPYIGEYLDETTGEWLKGDNPRSRHYNHSTFADLVIGGLVGLLPRADDTVEISPLVPADAWDYFCLDQVRYHGKVLSIIWDRTGARFNRGAGLTVFSNGATIAHSDALRKVSGNLPR